MKNYPVFLLCMLALSQCGSPPKTPIALHPENPHYFLFREKPTVLITSGEHYGAVMNLDFDYVPYLDALAADGLNLTRLFTGAYVEPAGAFNIDLNTMAPAEERFICPWARSTVPGYAKGGNKFDLNKWDEKYFERLRDFMSQSENRGVVVELALFCPFYEEVQWTLSPMNTTNNINDVGKSARTDVYTLDKNMGLLAVQETLVRKIVQELKDYPNLIYEICNEPYFGGVTLEWQRHIASVIKEEEKEFSQQHLISQNIANGHQKIENPDPAVSVFNFHYAYPPVAVAENYSLNKVMGDNETGFNGNSDSTYRKEGWAFILKGGALYNNLDYSFTAEHEGGTFEYPPTQPGGGSAGLRKQLGYLKGFMEQTDFVHMKPDTTTLMEPLPQGARLYLMSGDKEYVAYVTGKGELQISLDLAQGDYTLTWLNPENGEYSQPADVQSTGYIVLKTPPISTDLAFRLTRKH